jgi:hypothetical protein
MYSNIPMNSIKNALMGDRHNGGLGGVDQHKKGLGALGKELGLFRHKVGSLHGLIVKNPPLKTRIQREAAAPAEKAVDKPHKATDWVKKAAAPRKNKKKAVQDAEAVPNLDKHKTNPIAKEARKGGAIADATAAIVGEHEGHEAKVPEAEEPLVGGGGSKGPNVASAVAKIEGHIPAHAHEAALQKQKSEHTAALHKQRGELTASFEGSIQATQAENDRTIGALQGEVARLKAEVERHGGSHRVQAGALASVVSELEELRHRHAALERENDGHRQAKEQHKGAAAALHEQLETLKRHVQSIVDSGGKYPHAMFTPEQLTKLQSDRAAAAAQKPTAAAAAANAAAAAAAAAASVPQKLASGGGAAPQSPVAGSGAKAAKSPGLGHNAALAGLYGGGAAKVAPEPKPGITGLSSPPPAASKPAEQRHFAQDPGGDWELLPGYKSKDGAIVHASNGKPVASTHNTHKKKGSAV